MRSLFLCLLGIFFFGTGLFGQISGDQKIDPFLLEQFKTKPVNSFIIVLNDQIEFKPWEVNGSKTARAKHVFDKLKAKNEYTQRRLTDFLANRGLDFKSYYIVNAISSQGTLEEINQLISFNEVKHILADPWIFNPDYISSNIIQEKDPGVPEWGLERIGVEYAWDLGYKGNGVVVGGQDTGYDWEHSTLKDKYRGFKQDKANHNYNWHDAITEISPLHNDSIISPENNPCGLASNFPCDDHGHGTHTMGTMIGENESNIIGVAPKASWIGCRNMERGYGKPSTYLDCFEWFLAPTDTLNDNPDPSLAPHVINNSWRCPELEGCNENNWSLLETAVNNLKASGVVVVVSAGNDGGNCNDINNPPAMFENSLSVGAIGKGDTIADFSSWGPVSIDGSNRIKPDIVAPGVEVRSSFPGEEYRTWKGTSMSAPHVSGLVALLISANPELAGQVELIEGIIKTTAENVFHSTDCLTASGFDIPNHVFGYGIINTERAIQKALDFSTKEEISSSAIVYPNPTSHEIHFLTEGIEGNCQISFHDLQGKMFFTQDKLLNYFDKFKIDISSFQEGLYYYLIKKNQNVIKSGKILKL